MSVLLKNWPSVQISEVVDINPRPEIDGLDDETLVSFIPMRCVEEESGLFEPLENRKIKDVRKGYTPFRDGDVLFAKVTPCMENGKAAVMSELTNGIGFGSTEFFALRPSNGILPKFIFFFIAQESFRRAAAANMTGAVGLRRVPKNYLAEQPIPLPPLPEQRRIIAEIEKQFTRLDAGVAALRRVQANLKRYRAAVLKAACEGRLVPTEAELAKAEKRKSKFETGAQLLARILTDRRKKRSGKDTQEEPIGPDITKLPPLPKDWIWANIGQLRVFSLYGPRFSSDDYVDDGYVVLRTSDISESGKVDTTKAPRLRLSKEEFERYRAQRGDLLVTRTGSLGTLAIFDDDVEAIPGAYLIQFRLATEPVTTRYLFYLLKSPIGQSYLAGKGAGVGRPNLNAPTIEALVVPLPPLSEQIRIVAEVERRLSMVEEMEAVVNANLQRATRLRQSILQQAFAGQLVKSESTEIAKPKIQLSPKARRHFLRVLLSAEIVHQLHAEPTFGQIKHQKIFHLCEHIAQLTELEVQYHRDAAGPYDNRLIYTSESDMKRNNWYKEYPRERVGHAYRPLAKAGGHTKYLARSWPTQMPTITRLIELMRNWSTERCEIFSTTYAAWNDLLLWKREPTEEAILHEILHRWHESKQRIPEDRWRKAITWMKKEGFVPIGFGQPTAQPT